MQLVEKVSKKMKALPDLKNGINKPVRQKRTYELQRRRYTDELYSNERRYATGSDKSQHIMFVGDGGYCIGSTIKRHLKYRGQ
ncbi:uncharacterized protein RHIMIDRAFT_290759 [Rhizopus microsporus ATCC 52813]|uniref:Uncharacterized protein n=1 Tax=Rhizopus microsporus ATCC 52813 TaxID=1340429 RepID=A0A2G4SZY6_RHIZD|nr:uncharacterized protein RHIMIDRAFT_290759 [Rhizopus microsporus ATCC 52813]PHZ13976.1 hypothetical protein RHIMIDRAFT_290759 [Rhizopus microsporus ATCC 52813]